MKFFINFNNNSTLLFFNIDFFCKPQPFMPPPPRREDAKIRTRTIHTFCLEICDAYVRRGLRKVKSA